MMRLRYLVLVLFALWLAEQWVPTNRVTIVNESGRTAQGVRVEIAEEVLDCGNIPPGGTARARYVTPDQDASVTLRCQLAGGITINEPCIYTAWEEHFRDDTIVIKEDGSTTTRD